MATERAHAAARGIDQLLAAGTDLGPLMGVPVVIKDIFEVEGMPTTAGSKMAVADLIGPEGNFVGRLKHAGCVILGKASPSLTLARRSGPIFVDLWGSGNIIVNEFNGLIFEGVM